MSSISKVFPWGQVQVLGRALPPHGSAAPVLSGELMAKVITESGSKEAPLVQEQLDGALPLQGFMSLLRILFLIAGLLSIFEIVSIIDPEPEPEDPLSRSNGFCGMVRTKGTSSSVSAVYMMYTKV